MLWACGRLAGLQLEQQELQWALRQRQRQVEDEQRRRRMEEGAWARLAGGGRQRSQVGAVLAPSQLRLEQQQHERATAGSVSVQQELVHERPPQEDTTLQRDGSQLVVELRGDLHWLLEHCAPLLQHSSPQELSNVAWAIGKLALQPSSSWQGAFWAASGLLLPSFRLQELVATMFGLAKARLCPPRWWLASFFSGSGRLLAAAGPQEVSNLLWAFCYLHVRPPEAWMAAAVGQLQVQLPRSAACNVSMAMWAMAKLQYKPSKGCMVELLQAAHVQLDQCR